MDEPFVIGPDRESEQWVSAVAKGADAPYTVLETLRRGDRDVEISVETCPISRDERRCSSTTSSRPEGR